MDIKYSVVPCSLSQSAIRCHYQISMPSLGCKGATRKACCEWEQSLLSPPVLRVYLSINLEHDWLILNASEPDIFRDVCLKLWKPKIRAVPEPPLFQGDFWVVWRVFPLAVLRVVLLLPPAFTPGGDATSLEPTDSPAWASLWLLPPPPFLIIPQLKWGHAYSLCVHSPPASHGESCLVLSAPGLGQWPFLSLAA